METDYNLYLAGHEVLDSEDPNDLSDYLWTCECGSAGEDIQTRDAHVLTLIRDGAKILRDKSER